MLSTSIISVGIDIGTTTTQLVFSKLSLENTAGCFSVPHVTIVNKEIIYKSSIFFTPLKNQSLLDGTKLRHLIENEYNNAGITASEVDTGAIIVTGESSRKANAEIVTQYLSGFAGDFVVALAGPDLEAIIAGKGSGAYQYSVDQKSLVANIDIGGGTTNVVLFDNGEVVATGCLDVGGRHITIDNNGVITYISKSAERIADDIGVSITVMEKASVNKIKAICKRMIDLIEELIGLRPATPLMAEVKTPNSGEFVLDNHIEAIVISGGVADCIWTKETDLFRYGDIGLLLGEAIAQSRIADKVNIISAKETIRATVVGAGSYSTSISGSTIAHYGDILPLKNIPVFKLTISEQARCFEGDADFLVKRMDWFLSQSASANIALAFKGEKSPSYERIRSFATCIVKACSRLLPKKSPVLLVLETDIAMVLGRAVQNMLGSSYCVISIDNICVNNGDYIDLGRPMMDGLVIPVVVKTLAFA